MQEITYFTVTFHTNLEQRYHPDMHVLNCVQTSETVLYLFIFMSTKEWTQWYA